MATIDAAAELAIWARRVTDMLAKDLAELTPEQLRAVPGGKARSAWDIAEEVIQVNQFMVRSLQGSRVAKGEAPTDQDSLVAKIRETGEALASAIETHREKLLHPTKAPWGEETTVYQMAQLTVNHILYHDGQVAYLQRLHGDDQLHWFK